jgi:uncharacterized membrane protein YfcA
MIVFLILIGCLAGVVNTLSGNGSILTFLTLIQLGEDANIANGTNRLGAASQSPLSLFYYHKQGKVKPLFTDAKFYILPTLFGAIIGAFIVVSVSKELLEVIFGVVMIIILLSIFIKPKEWLASQKTIRTTNFTSFLIFLGIGFYAGFVQMGMGILLLMGLVLRGGFTIRTANIVKMMIVVVLTVPALLVFVIHNQIHLFYGITLLISQGIGAYIGARMNVKNQNTEKIAYFLVIIMTTLGIIKLLVF